MQSTAVRRNICVGVFLVSLGVNAIVFFQGRASGQERAAATGQQTETVVLDNTRVHVRHITFPAGGFRQQMHSVGKAGDNRYDLMILLTPAQLEGQVDDKKMVSDKPGTIWEIPGAPSQHAFANLSNQPIDVLVVQVK
jgi:hypothetical protein